MTTPKITRPAFPKGYAEKPTSFLTWDWVATQLTNSKHYWLCSVRPDGRESPSNASPGTNRSVSCSALRGGAKK